MLLRYCKKLVTPGFLRSGSGVFTRFARHFPLRPSECEVALPTLWSLIRPPMCQRADVAYNLIQIGKYNAFVPETGRCWSDNSRTVNAVDPSAGSWMDETWPDRCIRQIDVHRVSLRCTTFQRDFGATVWRIGD